VPTAWVQGFDKVPRDGDGMIGQARSVLVQANLNQVFVACASQSGRTHGARFLGSSLIADPYGNLASGPLDENDEGLAVASVDFGAVTAAQVRSDLIRPRQDRRTDMYALNISGQTL
jgi:N-carbamoylputrescine amidase